MWRVLEKSALPLTVAAAVSLTIAFVMIFFNTPVEAKMGIVQKIFYVHVPSALAMYAGFIICSASSFVYLLRPSRILDDAARTGVEVGLFFGAFVMISGPMWGYKAWGKAWVWEPQLTATLVLVLLYGAYALLRQLSGDSARIRKIGAVLAVIALADIPVIRYAVKNWGGQHPVIEKTGGGGMIAEMKVTFSISMFAFLLLFCALFTIALLQRRFARRVDETFVELEDVAFEYERAGGGAR